MSIKVPSLQITAMPEATPGGSAIAIMNNSAARQAQANRLFSGGGGGIQVSTVKPSYNDFSTGSSSVVEQQKTLISGLLQSDANAKYDNNLVLVKKGGSKRKTKRKRRTKRNKKKTKNYRKQKRRN